ncbi:unnamed protein product [Triticum turgidum subsp. durum]|uniref:Transglycosylase SLT domain-containing protein n=1 Tax=Triticum turgidum subsp. durum TaxID=4567 RepID=A0A9R1AYG4_TRITD|nr:unnamed protein product [Triticum turgidum subsp. durum]
MEVTTEIARCRGAIFSLLRAMLARLAETAIDQYKMPVSFKYWDDCLDPDDIQLMWADPHAVAAITVQRHFKSQLDPVLILFLYVLSSFALVTVIGKYMIGALAEIASGRRLFVDDYDRKTKETKMGIMQVTPEVAQWLGRELGYKNYDIELEDNIDLLYWPFINVYFGAAYAKWLFSCDENRQPDSFNELAPDLLENSSTAGTQLVYWDSKVSEEDMGGMWSQPDVLKEWTNSGERRGNVRFSHDAKKRPYLSRVEVKAVAEIIISRHFSSRGVKPEALAALAEVSSMRFVHGVRSRTGLMGIDYPTAAWLSSFHIVVLTCSLHFEYVEIVAIRHTQERSHEFIVQAYLGGPDKVNLQETGPYWKKFLEALVHYEDPKKQYQDFKIDVILNGFGLS